jgi:hypothetical protein
MHYIMYVKRAAEACTTGGTGRLRREPVRSSSVPTGGKDVVAKFANFGMQGLANSIPPILETSLFVNPSCNYRYINQL